MVARPPAALAVLPVLLAALLAPGTAAAPPPDAFCVILFEAADASFTTVRVLVDLETNLTQRQELFGQLDLDADGDVDPLEQERLRSATVRQHNTTAAMGLTALTLAAADGQQQWGAEFLAAKTWTQVGHTFHKQAHTTPAFITDAADLETQEVREVYFRHPRPPTLVRLGGGTDPALTPTFSPSPTPAPSSTGPTTTVAIEYVVLRAPAGWVVQQATGHSYDGPVSIDGGVRELDLPAFDTKKPFTVRFAQAPEESSTTASPPPGDGSGSETTATPRPSGEERGAPQAPFVALLAVLAMAASGLRRRL